MSCYLKKNDMSQVMSNSGFGNMITFDSFGTCIAYSQKAIKKDGTIKKAVKKLITSLTPSNLLKLDTKYGVIIIKAISNSQNATKIKIERRAA